jgi:hypothetical protein
MRFLPAAAAAVPFVALLLAGSEAPAQGFTVTSGDASLTLGGQVQTQFNTSDAAGVPDFETALRRVRISSSVRVNALISGRIVGDFGTARATVRDAYVLLTFDPGLRLLAGNAYRPFGRVEQTSSTRIIPVERGLRIRGVGGYEANTLVTVLGYADRDVGIQLMGEPAGAPLGLGYAVGLFNGPLRDQAPGADSYQLAGRVTLQPAPAVQLGAGVATRHFLADGAVPEARRSGLAWETDVALGSDAGGPLLVAEVVGGDFDAVTGARFLGAQGWLSYRTGPLSAHVAAVEPLLRASWGDANRGGVPAGGAIPGGVLVTPGVNLWLGGRNRLQINYDVWNPERGDGARSGKVQLQLAF